MATFITKLGNMGIKKAMSYPSSTIQVLRRSFHSGDYEAMMQYCPQMQEQRRIITKCGTPFHPIRYNDHVPTGEIKIIKPIQAVGVVSSNCPAENMVLRQIGNTVKLVSKHANKQTGNKSVKVGIQKNKTPTMHGKRSTIDFSRIF
jgi:hypothetical protein